MFRHLNAVLALRTTRIDNLFLGTALNFLSSGLLRGTYDWRHRWHHPNAQLPGHCHRRPVLRGSHSPLAAPSRRATRAGHVKKELVVARRGAVAVTGRPATGDDQFLRGRPSAAADTAREGGRGRRHPVRLKRRGMAVDGGAPDGGIQPTPTCLPSSKGRLWSLSSRPASTSTAGKVTSRLSSHQRHHRLPPPPPPPPTAFHSRPHPLGYCAGWRHLPTSPRSPLRPRAQQPPLPPPPRLLSRPPLLLAGVCDALCANVAPP